MKSSRYQRRFYRGWVYPGPLHETRLCVRETDLHILTDIPVDEAFCLERVRSLRGAVEDYINRRDPRFQSSLKPLAVELTAPPVVRRMAAAAAKAGVGPMAAVAGAVAQFLGQSLLRKGCRDVIVENGGDIFLRLRRDARVGIYAGRSRFSSRLSLKVPAPEGSLGIATSSGTVGHSLSFGSADSATIIASDAILADAVATATGNRVKGKKDLEAAIAFARSVKGVRGALIVYRSSLAAWGAVSLAE